MCACLDRLQVGAGARLGHRDRADELAPGHARQPALLLLLGAVVEQVVRDDAVDRVTETRDAAPAEFLDDDGLVAHVAAAAAVAVRNVRAEQPDFSRPRPQLAIDVMLLAEARVVRDDLVLDETPRGVPEEVQLLVHPRRSMSVRVRVSMMPTQPKPMTALTSRKSSKPEGTPFAAETATACSRRTARRSRASGRSGGRCRRGCGAPRRAHGRDRPRTRRLTARKACRWRCGSPPPRPCTAGCEHGAEDLLARNGHVVRDAAEYRRPRRNPPRAPPGAPDRPRPARAPSLIPVSISPWTLRHWAPLACGPIVGRRDRADRRP